MGFGAILAWPMVFNFDARAIWWRDLLGYVTHDVTHAKAKNNFLAEYFADVLQVFATSHFVSFAVSHWLNRLLAIAS